MRPRGRLSSLAPLTALGLMALSPPADAAGRLLPASRQEPGDLVGQAVEGFSSAADAIVTQARIRMNETCDSTHELFFQVRTTYGLKNASSRGDKELEEIYDVARRSLADEQLEVRHGLVDRGVSPNRFARDLDRITENATTTLTSSYDSFADWLHTLRQEVQVSFLDQDLLHVAILIVLQYDGALPVPGEDPARDRDIEGSAMARQAELEGQKKRTVLKVVDPDTDLFATLREARAEARAMIGRSRRRGEIRSLEFFGHGVPSGGLVMPGPVAAYGQQVRVLGGFSSLAPAEPESYATGRFLGAIKGTVASSGRVTYSSSWSSGNPQVQSRGRRDIVTLTSGLTGLFASGTTGRCLFPAGGDGATPYRPPVSQQDGASSQQPVRPEEARRDVNNNLDRRHRRSLEETIKRAEAEARSEE